jgi:hypothetical protein
MKTYTNGNRQIRKLANPEPTRIAGMLIKWEGAIDGEWFCKFVDDRNGTAEQNARSWLSWTE